ncbi:MAG: hypothetical protein KU37_05680 [Sulfuricurvum sp. PC08-66]|nr:MAG: hypothetical protein KU37_05680 [Sulfuricurvum sp. PC08-66]
MKKFLGIIAALALTVSASASEFEKKGFLTTKACAEKGIFADCSLDAFVCGTEGCFRKAEPGVITKEELVLFVHSEGKIYNLDASKFSRAHLDEGVSRNEVTIIGEFDKSTNTIVVTEFSPPPPPAKSFFKGCL